MHQKTSKFINKYFPVLMLLPALILLLDIYENGLASKLTLIRVFVNIALFGGGIYILFSRLIDYLEARRIKKLNGK